MPENSKILPNLLQGLREINFGIILMGIYFLLDFGAIQGVIEFTQTLYIPFIVAALSVVYALYLIITRNVGMESTTKSFLLLFLFIIIYSQIDTQNPFEKKSCLTLFLQYFANFIILIYCIKKPFQFILIIDIWLLSILHSSYHSIMQGGKLYDSIWLKDENHISIINAMAIPFSFVLFLSYKSKVKKAFYLLCMVLNIVSSIVATSRGGILAMVSVIVLSLFAHKKYLKKALIILIVGIILVLSYAPNRLFTEMETLKQGTEEGTAADRIYLWGIAFRMFHDQPIIGIGITNYPWYFLQYERNELYRSGDVLRVAHSTPIQWLAETGMVGFIILIILQLSLYSNWRVPYRHPPSLESQSMAGKTDLLILKSLNNACAISQVGFIICSLFLSLLNYPFYWAIIPFSAILKKMYLDQIYSRDTDVPDLPKHAIVRINNS